MGNIYIETDENFRVTKVHRMPFDPNNGMGYSREELEQKGFFVEDIPEPVHQTGRRSIMMYNPDTKGIYYELVNIPLSDKERIDQLENAMNSALHFLSFMVANSTYGIQPATMLLEDEPTPTVKLTTQEEWAAKYLANQIISGKLELNQCVELFPQFEEVIKDTLKDNGIQV